MAVKPLSFTTSTAGLTLLVLLLMMVYPVCVAEEIQCRDFTTRYPNQTAEISPVLDKNEAALLLLLGFGSLSIILAVVYILIRRYIFDDVNNLDSTFDAGGNVSASLTAVTIAAQLLWPADLMQSATVAVKYGLAGVFWYCAAVLVNVSLFPLLSFKFKTRAPGAKTYLQIILARFGRPTHTLFCVFALLVNVIILSSILVGGIAVLQISIKDASPEYCILIIVALCGSYSFIGGLGSTFYVSYFNALTTFVVLGTLVFNVFYMDDKPFGTFEEIYAKINCLPEVKGNRDGSYFTFLSEGALLWAVQGVLLVSSITYCDQASWQSRIAAKPLQGAIGFLLAGFIWFAVPATIGTVTGLTYLAEWAEDPSIELSPDQINSGIVSAYMSEKAMGKQGGVMMLTMLTMLTMSTGSGEIMGVSSIIVYDIYQIYIRPFRFNLKSTDCIFCGYQKQDLEKNLTEAVISEGRHFNPLCKCPAVLTCSNCKPDLEKLKSIDKAPGKIVQYKCPYHGDYRKYQDSLINFKNWCVLWVALALVPFGLVVNASGMNLNWIMLTGIILTAPCFPGVILCILWSRTTRQGMIIGSILGLVLGITTNLVVAYEYYEGEGGFLVCTALEYAVVGGSLTSVLVSLFMTVVISLFTHKIKTQEDEDREWQKMRDIDNPLHSWTQQYVEDFPEVKDGLTRPTYSQLDSVSKLGRRASIIGSIVFFFIFIVLIPGVMASLEVLTASEFQAWTTVINVWCIIMAVIIICVTPFEEVKGIIKQIRFKRRKASKDGDSAQESVEVTSNNGRVANVISNETNDIHLDDSLMRDNTDKSTGAYTRHGETKYKDGKYETLF